MISEGHNCNLQAELSPQKNTNLSATMTDEQVVDFLTVACKEKGENPKKSAFGGLGRDIKKRWMKRKIKNTKQTLQKNTDSALQSSSPSIRTKGAKRKSLTPQQFDKQLARKNLVEGSLFPIQSAYKTNQSKNLAIDVLGVPSLGLTIADSGAKGVALFADSVNTPTALITAAAGASATGAVAGTLLVSGAVLLGKSISDHKENTQELRNIAHEIENAEVYLQREGKLESITKAVELRKNTLENFHTKRTKLNNWKNKFLGLLGLSSMISGGFALGKVITIAVLGTGVSMGIAAALPWIAMGLAGVAVIGITVASVQLARKQGKYGKTQKMIKKMSLDLAKTEVTMSKLEKKSPLLSKKTIKESHN